MSKSKIIVIDGLDGSGKKTQADLLLKTIQGSKFLDYPNYEDESASLVNMYLQGRISENPFDVNPYIASSTYALDRAISYMKYWKEEYNKGDNIFIANRYTTSNLIHQMCKLPESEYDSFIDYIKDLEYNKYELPEPDLIIFLTVDRNVSESLMSKRYTDEDGNIHEEKRDIHERNKNYLDSCIKSAVYSIMHENWKVVNCTPYGVMKSPEEIHKSIASIVADIL